MAIDEEETKVLMKGQSHWCRAVGDGWRPLVQQTIDRLRAVMPDIKIVQVKEKFGGLRIYTDIYTPAIQQIIIEAEAEATKVCEYCGSRCDVDTRGGGWIKTLCADCHKQDTFDPRD